MKSIEKLAEASALLRTVEKSQDLTVAQRDACTHIRGLVDVLASSVETLQEIEGEPLRTDGGTATKYRTEGTPTGWSHGDVAVDVDQDDRPMVRVVEVLDELADDYVLYETEGGAVETVADYHRGRYPADDQVVVAAYETQIQQFEDGLDVDLDRGRLVDVLRALDVDVLESRTGEKLKLYAFPESRLEVKR